MKEKTYKVIESTAVGNLVIGILTILSGVTMGIMLIISGARLLKNKSGFMI